MGLRFLTCKVVHPIVRNAPRWVKLGGHNVFNVVLKTWIPELRVNPVLKRLRQEDHHELETSVNY